MIFFGMFKMFVKKVEKIYGEQYSLTLAAPGFFGLVFPQGGHIVPPLSKFW